MMKQFDTPATAGLPATTVLWITLVCFAISMIDGLDTLMLSFIAPLLAKSLQIDHATLGRVFGAGFVGTMLGSMTVGPAADRFGRRPMLVLALIVTGCFTLACAFASSAGTLAALRFVGGVGMGGAIPPLAAIVAESSSPQRRSSLVILMCIGFPAGVVVGGSISAVLMMQYGWQSVFLMGGASALIALIPVLLVIPSQSPSRPQSVAQNDAPTARAMSVRTSRRPQAIGNPLGQGRLPATLALWFGVLASFIVSSFLISFIPTMLNMNGVAPARAAFGAIALNIGAIFGALVISVIARRMEPFVPVVIGFLGSAVLTFVLGHIITAGNVAFVMLFAVGACHIGCQLTFPAIASALYPVEARGAGIGWAMALARAGSIIGPMVGGILLSERLPFAQLFTFTAVLAVCGSLGIALANRWRLRDNDAQMGSTASVVITDLEMNHGK
ncbi:MFS transporter [Paraburkholderia sp. MM5477-R1]|uniref:MFS transporter n=1 Tax=Paraburkholderia sp. MM5477-R1 TaxID=2991062 RepID=UPI003D21876E